jgi:hypothetical protein
MSIATKFIKVNQPFHDNLFSFFLQSLIGNDEEEFKESFG